jgi:hypothetical protein
VLEAPEALAALLGAIQSSSQASVS